MNIVDVAVIGGGSAGSLAAAMLGRAGVSTILVDIHQTYPEDFRCEKIHTDQAVILEKTGLFNDVLPAGTIIPEMWLTRGGFKLRMRGKPYEYGIAYNDLVNAFRRQIPGSIRFINAKAIEITTSSDRQTIRLSNGQVWSSRLVILATGLNGSLVNDRITRTEISKCHSISIGFDITSKSGFQFPALTYFAERPGPTAYLTMFPMGLRMRANMFVYREFRDPWIQQLRESPLPTILGVMPRLKRYMDGIEVASDVRIRPADLYRADNYLHPGLVLVGDTFCTSCPAAGTGLNKVLTDIERLCNHYIPIWLATPEMGVDKLTEFYNDPVKTACDKWSIYEAYYQRSLAMDTTVFWQIRRFVWFIMRWVQWMQRRFQGMPLLEPDEPSQPMPAVITREIL